MRKRKSGAVALAVLLCVTMIWSGCSTSWIKEAEQIVSVLIPGAVNLITLVAALQEKTVSAVDLSKIQNAGSQATADLQLIQALIAAYQSADEAAKPGTLSQIQSALNAVQGNLQGLMGGLHIQNAATQSKVTAVVGLLLSEVQSLAAIVPLVQGPAVEARVNRASTGVKAPLSANEFVKSYNATLTAKTGNAELDRVSAGLGIHLHSKAERLASAGVLR